MLNFFTKQAESLEIFKIIGLVVFEQLKKL